MSIEVDIKIQLNQIQENEIEKKKTQIQNKIYSNQKLY
jgi:hypothetical protein